MDPSVFLRELAGSIVLKVHHFLATDRKGILSRVMIVIAVKDDSIEDGRRVAI